MHPFPAGYTHTPRCALIVATAAAWWAAQPELTAYYYSAQLRRGTYPPDADSIAIPIFSTWAMWAVATPAVVALLVWVARRGAGGVSYTATSPTRPARTAVTSVLALAAVLMLLDSAVGDWRDGYPLLALVAWPGLLVTLWIRSAVVAAPARAAASGVAAT